MRAGDPRWLATDYPQRSFAANDRKVHAIDSVFFVNDIVPLGLQAGLFERAPEKIVLARAEKRVVDLPCLGQAFPVGQDKCDAAQATAGDGYGSSTSLPSCSL